MKSKNILTKVSIFGLIFIISLFIKSSFTQEATQYLASSSSGDVTVDIATTVSGDVYIKGGHLIIAAPLTFETADESSWLARLFGGDERKTNIEIGGQSPSIWYLIERVK